MANISKIKVSGVTYNIVDSSAIHSLEGYWNSGETQNAITAATNALAEAIAEQGYQTSGDVQSAISGKADSDSVYTKQETSDLIDQKIVEASGITSGQVQTMIDESVSGKLDTSTFETYSGNVNTALASKIAGASWDSNTSHLNFYDNVSATGTPLTYVDGADWVKDSFLKSVTIEDKEISGETVTCLVFVFETESGETETDIPLTDIFDPDNYVSLATYTAYTAATDAVLTGKAETTAVTEAISEATSGKVDNTVYTAYTAATNETITGINATLTAHTADTDIHVTTAQTAAWSAKQDALVSGTNIKTIGTESVLGSGNISVLHASVGTGDDAETLILELS